MTAQTKGAGGPVTIDIDVGGTFTDGFFAQQGRNVVVKVDTTPHDLAECFWTCLEGGAERLGLPSVAAMLGVTQVTRFATTVGTNAILEGSGPRIGLLVSKGEERRVYASDGDSPLLAEFLDPALVIGVQAETDAGTGYEDEIREAVKRLLELGARQIVVSLRGDGRDGRSERRLRDIVRKHFPEHYVCSAPVILSSEIRQREDDFSRTNTAVIDAYLRRDLARSLYRTEDRLREARYPFPLLITHSSGGAARVAKTRAVDTYNSGPSAGLLGCVRYAVLNDLDRAVTVDMGGTSTDLGLIENGIPAYDFRSEISGVSVDLPFYFVRSIGGGGGSIAALDEGTKQLRVGPESAGSIPGPAAYGLGGADATVTDACLILGYLDPDRFLGGRRKLDAEAAGRVLMEKIANPLRLEVEQAALAIFEELGTSVVRTIRELTDDRAEGSWPIFAFGGAGGLFAARLSSELGERAFLFRHGAVLNAFGSSQLEVVHLYERPVGSLVESTDVSELSAVADRVQPVAEHDMRAEGLEVTEWWIEIELFDEPSGETAVARRRRDGSWEDLVGDLLNDAAPRAAVVAMRVYAVAGVAHPDIAEFSFDGTDSSAALVGIRPIILDESGPRDSPVYEWERLKAGNRIAGPAIVEGLDTTVLVPADFELAVTGHLDAVLSLAGGGA